MATAGAAWRPSGAEQTKAGTISAARRRGDAHQPSHADIVDGLELAYAQDAPMATASSVPPESKLVPKKLTVPANAPRATSAGIHVLPQWSFRLDGNRREPVRGPSRAIDPREMARVAREAAPT